MSSKKIDPPDDGGGGENHKKVDQLLGEGEDEEDWPICVITSTTTVGATGSTSKTDGEGDDGNENGSKIEGQEKKKDTSNATSTVSQNSKEQSASSSASKLENSSSSSTTAEKSTENVTKPTGNTLNGSSSKSTSLQAKASNDHVHDDHDDGLVKKSVKPSIPSQQTDPSNASGKEEPEPKQHNRFLKMSSPAPSLSVPLTKPSLLLKDKPKEMAVPVKAHTFKKPAVPPPPPPAPPTAPLYACPKCDLEFTTRSILNTHLNDAHPIARKATPPTPGPPPPKGDVSSSENGNGTSAPSGPPYDCPECNHRFPNPFQLKKHSIIHNKPLQCPLCPQTYLAMEALNLHKRYIHDSSKLHWFKCQVCGKSDFLLLSDLYTHRVECHPEMEWMGEREKPFGCGVCQRPFLRKGDALVCAVLGHEPGGILEVMFQWRCEECPEDLGYWRVEELRGHWEGMHNDKEMPEEVVSGNGGDNGGQLPCVQIDKREAYDLKENWEGKGEEGLILEFELLEGEKGGVGKGRGCEIPVFGCPDCLLTFVDVESLRIHEKVHLRDEGPPMPSPVKKRGRPKSKSGRGGGEEEGGGEGKGVMVLEMMGSPDKRQVPISLVEEGEGALRGRHLIPKYDCQVCGKRFRKLKRLREHEVYHKLEDPDCKVFPKVVGRGGRKKGGGGGGGKTAMQKKIAHAGGILRGRGRPKKVRMVVKSPRREEEMEREGMEWWEEALLDEEEEMEEMEREFKCGSCEAAFYLAKQLRMHELAAHNAPHRRPGRKPRGGEEGGEERLVEERKEGIKRRRKGGGDEGGMEEKVVRPGRIKVGRLEISTRLNKEIKDSEPIRLSGEGMGEDGRKGPQYKCPRCPKEFRDKRGIHLHILGHSLKGGPGEKQMMLDEDAGEGMGEEMEGAPEEIGERRMSDRERKVPRKLSDFEVEDGGEEEEGLMEVESEVKVAIEAPPQVKVGEGKKKKLPRELVGEAVKNMTILQAEGRLEERKEGAVKVTAEVASTAFEKISGQIVGMKKEKMAGKKKIKVIKVGKPVVKSGGDEGEGEGPPVPDYYGAEGNGEVASGGEGGDKVTCQTCGKSFESVELLWYHCSEEHFNKGGKVKVKYVAKTEGGPEKVGLEATGMEGEMVRKEVKTYGSAKKPAFLALLEKRREEQCPPSPTKIVAPAPQAPETETGPSEVPATKPSDAPEPVRNTSEVPATLTKPSEVAATVQKSKEEPATVTKLSEVPAKKTPSRPPPPALIPLNTSTAKDNGAPPPQPPINQKKMSPPKVRVQAPANTEDNLKKTPVPPPAKPVENVKKPVTTPEQVKPLNIKLERRMSIEAPKSKPEVKVIVTTPSPSASETIKMKAPLQVKTLKVIQPITKIAPAPQPEVKTISPKVSHQPAPQPEVKRSSSPVKPEVTKTFTIKSNPDLSISIVKTRPTQQVFTSSTTTPSTSMSPMEPKPEVSISLVKRQQQQQIMAKQPSQLSVSLVKSKVIQVPIPSTVQFPHKNNVPTFKLSELIRCASKKYPLPPNLPKLSNQQSAPHFSKQRPPPLTPAPGARSPPKPVAFQSQSPSLKSAVSVPVTTPTPPKLEQPKRKIILVSRKGVVISPPNKLEEPLKKMQQITPSIKQGSTAPPKLEEPLRKPQQITPHIKQGPSAPPPKLEGTLKKADNQVISPQAPKPLVPPKVEEIKKVYISSPPKKLEEPLKEKRTEAQQAPPKVEETLKKKQESQMATPPALPAATTPKAVPKLEETLKNGGDNQKASATTTAPAALINLKESLKKKLEDLNARNKLKEKEIEKKAENIEKGNPPPKQADPSLPPKLEETSKKIEKTQQVAIPVTQHVKVKATPPKKSLEAEPVKKPEIKKVSPPTKPAEPTPPKLEETEKKAEKVLSTCPLPAPPKLEEPSLQKKIEKPEVAPAPPKLEEPLSKPEIKAKIPTPPTKPADPSPPPKLEETEKKEEKVVSTCPSLPPKLEETSEKQEDTPPSIPPVPPKEPEVETPINQSAASTSLSSARVVASAPLSKSTSSTENPTLPQTPLQVPSTPNPQKPPLSSPTANEFRFKIIKQSVILPFKKRPGRPSPKYLEYLEGKQKGSKSKSGAAGTSKTPLALLKKATASQAPSKTTPKPGVSEETEPIKIEASPQTGSEPSIPTSSSNPPIKRKRGRPWPPKTTPTTTATPTTPPSGSNGTIKRKRGRPWPPKVPPTSTTTKIPPDSSTSPQRAIIKPSSISPDIVSTSLSRRKTSPASELPVTAEQSVEEPPPLEEEPAIKKPKRGVGRPRTRPIVVKDPNAPKRKRGRPRREASMGTSMEESFQNGSMEESPKSSVEADQSLGTEGEGVGTSSEGGTPQVVKKRGRPFKKRRGRLSHKINLPVNQEAAIRRHSTTSTVAPPVGGEGKRGRGRPRKSMPILTPAVD